MVNVKNSLEINLESARPTVRLQDDLISCRNRTFGVSGGTSNTPEVDLGSNRKTESDRWLQRDVVPQWKRVLDVSIVLLSIPVWGPLFLVIAGLIKICSRGPVLFRQERVGFQGSHFICLKFRSMKVGADTGVHKDYLKELINSDTPMVKMDARGDTRLIPFGSLLRSTGLDELPQLINVLRGEMSLVGPRPSIPYEYDDFLPWQKARCGTLPGLTGLWQVSGKNRTTFNEMINLDIAYVNHKSPLLDLKIILGTIPAIVTQILDTRNARRPKLAAIANTRSVKTTI